jgi:hypothetical protein
MAMVAERSASMSMVSLVLLPIDGRSSLVLVYMMGRVWLVFASDWSACVRYDGYNNRAGGR